MSGEHGLTGIGSIAKNATKQGTKLEDSTKDRGPGQETPGREGGGGGCVIVVDHSIGPAVGTTSTGRFVRARTHSTYQKLT